MKITKIYVSNFKSFNKETIELNDLNIIVGSNAAGKSNLVSIFRFIDNIKNYGIDNAISLAGGLGYLLNTTIGKKRPLNIAFSFSCENENLFKRFSSDGEDMLSILGYDYEFEITPNRQGSGYSITKDEIVLNYCQFSKAPGQKNKKADYSKTYKQIYKRSNNKLVYDEENKTDYKDKGDGNHKNEQDYIIHYFNTVKLKKELILNYISMFMHPALFTTDIVRIYDFDPKLMKKSSSLTSIGELEEDGSNIANILQNLLKSKHDKGKLENILKDCLPFVESIKTESNFDKSVSYKIKERFSKKPLYANFISDGTVSILAIIIALNFETNMGTIVLEEPERNLHPYLMNRLVEMAKETSNEKQIIITTHTPELIKHADINDVLLVSRNDKGYSCISRPKDNELVQEFLKNDVGIDSLFVQNLLGE